MLLSVVLDYRSGYSQVAAFPLGLSLSVSLSCQFGPKAVYVVARDGWRGAAAQVKKTNCDGHCKRLNWLVQLRHHLWPVGAKKTRLGRQRKKRERKEIMRGLLTFTWKKSRWQSSGESLKRRRVTERRPLPRPAPLLTRVQISFNSPPVFPFTAISKWKKPSRSMSVISMAVHGKTIAACPPHNRRVEVWAPCTIPEINGPLPGGWLTPLQTHPGGCHKGCLLVRQVDTAAPCHALIIGARRRPAEALLQLV